MPQNKRILIVDDQQDLREQMAKLLSRSSRRSETVSIVQQMRSRLLGGAQQADDDSDETAEELGGYKVDTASQGQEALEKIKKSIEAKNPYSVVFLDMRMPPGWDGMETATKIRQADKFIEIVIMTAYADHDQDTISKSVGTPDKLLYIKKPFQAEEIFQLALCLTSKWSAEEAERQRKSWFENMIRSVTRLKSMKQSKTEEVCASVLKSLLLFTNSPKGLIASSSDGKWKLECVSGLENSEALIFVEEHSAKLSQQSAPQQADGCYYLPLKRDGCTAAAALFNMASPSDPEWHKLLNLLSMTASETLCQATAQEELRRSERADAAKIAANRISAACLPLAKALAGKASSVPGAADDAKAIEALFSKIQTLLSAPEAKAAGRFTLASAMQSVCAEAKDEAPAGLELSSEVAGSVSAEAFADQNLLKEAVKTILSSRALAASKAGAKAIAFKIDVKPNNGAGFKISIADDGPLLPEVERQALFEPFALAEGLHGLGLSLPYAKRLLAAAGISLKAEPGRPKGLVFSLSLPPPPKQ